ncbi:hypothetical protein F5Y15DRAFT_410691 [Xylariaceae sp. FL0016]|nr:hypothetical protein F5Y15DRAFT_410691 [Xylariaceae sp. FL0016]
MTDNDPNSSSSFYRLGGRRGGRRSFAPPTIQSDMPASIRSTSRASGISTSTSRFIEHLELDSMIPPPAQFMTQQPQAWESSFYISQNSSATLVASSGASCTSLAATPPGMPPIDTHQRRHEMAQRRQAGEMEERLRAEAQRQRRQEELEMEAKDVPQQLEEANTVQTLTTFTPTMAPPPPPAERPDAIPMRPDTDEQSRPTAAALDWCHGKYGPTDPRSVNNVFNYAWLNTLDTAPEDPDRIAQREGQPTFRGWGHRHRCELVPQRNAEGGIGEEKIWVEKMFQGGRIFKPIRWDEDNERKRNTGRADDVAVDEADGTGDGEDVKVHEPSLPRRSRAKGPWTGTTCAGTRRKFKNDLRLLRKRFSELVGLSAQPRRELWEEVGPYGESRYSPGEFEAVASLAAAGTKAEKAQHAIEEDTLMSILPLTRGPSTGKWFRGQA